jgi:glycosyltransferase involved in cell wall biosynthesis
MVTALRDDFSAAAPSISPGRRLRIAVIAPPFFPIPPSGYGGIERVVAWLVDGLNAAGHDVTLYAAPGSVTSARLVTPLDVSPVLGDGYGVADELFHGASAYMSAEQFDVIHDHTVVGPALGALLDHAPPVVHTVHGAWVSSTQRLLGLLHDRLQLVAISHAQRAANPRLTYAGVVYNGIDVNAHPFNPVKEDFLVFVGRSSPEKRPEVAIEVAREAGLPLVMMLKRVEAAERDYWEQVVAPLLDKDIEVLEEPSQDVKVDIMGRARAMLFPIDWPEPFGLVMTEAMACGTPVIARPLGSAPEIIVDGVTGFLCTSEDEMVDAVTAVGDVKPEACRLRVEKHFSREAMVAGYERVYRAVLSQRARGARGGVARGPAAVANPPVG